MARHEVGGYWTTNSLERLGKYRRAHMTIFTKSSRARDFTTIYVDAFADTGHRVRSVRRPGTAGVPDEGTDAELASPGKGIRAKDWACGRDR